MCLSPKKCLKKMSFNVILEVTMIMHTMELNGATSFLDIIVGTNKHKKNLVRPRLPILQTSCEHDCDLISLFVTFDLMKIQS